MLMITHNDAIDNNFFCLYISIIARPATPLTLTRYVFHGNAGSLPNLLWLAWGPRTFWA